MSKLAPAYNFVLVLLLFICIPKGDADELSSSPEATEIMSPLILNLKLDSSSNRLEVVIKNKGVRDLILDMEAINAIQFSFSFFRKDGRYTDTGYVFTSSSGKRDITNESIRKALGKRYFLLKSDASTSIFRSIRPISVELEKQLAQIDAGKPLHIQAYSFGVLVGTSGRDVILIESGGSDLMSLSNIISIDSLMFSEVK